AYGGGQATENPAATATSGWIQQNVSTVHLNNPRTWDGAMVVCRAFNNLTTPNTNFSINGFQPNSLGGREFRSMTSFASVLDGLSNTAFVGEKAVHKDGLGNANA